MTVYLGKNPVGVGRIVEKKVAKEKFGATVDNFLGTVDADGNYVAPSEPFEVNLAGVKSVPKYGFVYRWFRGTARNAISIVANDVVSVAEKSFASVLSANGYTTNAYANMSFDGLETIEANNVFESALGGSGKADNINASFKKLKKISGNSVFYAFCSVKPLNELFERSFPNLEEITGNSVFDRAGEAKKNIPIVLQNVKKITGSTSQYSTTFGSIYVQNTVWNFPSATEFTGYIWNISSSYAGEIHFAAANQAAIEACDGYANKWGFAGATIFWDL